MGNIGTLFVVATPIGNLGDISTRAIETLKKADMVLCEDTRVTKKLLSHFDIATETLSYHSHSGLAKVDKIIGLLQDGKLLALVTDAGTPGISDPGSALVSAVRKQLPSIRIEAVPGPSALTAALSISGLPSSDFLFLGFPPQKKGRKKFFDEVAEQERTVVLYESPHRFLKTLAELNGRLSEKRTVVVAREMTKLYENVVTGPIDGVVNYFNEHPDEVRGEFVISIGS
ncbi:16S rRNA (cytidine(1402)-2'-O)-methyltransferase [Candidatus Kaiserbacteria bacterium CG10_big_fil_rev_8_21_14_0_10_49_17]|uniref:Ribosomal RNA small subunit methyltransferase I n=1 Tax=Candidatus Kaiserbacteria bacterium CG10_big_fil_rev_8_21_14_0_10_49_17 TaxID=1974609 RepID=A0A2M6WDU3_9BACT|nr:MAG: 16S rRNA (cytidine(1402)-2'-O)-methyltransferase [Candidatus Kaiserbacteria bacterium CG10_big_fil_rev_8_21_14_0_10_49_17]